MALQQDELGEVIHVGGRTLEIIELSRVRADRAEAERDRAGSTATDWRAAATSAVEKRRQAEQSASFWHAEAQDLAEQLRGYRRREWLMVALSALVAALALALFATALGWV